MTVIRNMGHGLARCESCETVFVLRNGEHTCEVPHPAMNAAAAEWRASVTKPEPDTKSATTNVDAVLNERGLRYGKFEDHASISQSLKMVVSTVLQDRNERLAPDQQEAIDMIFHKVARIVNGDPNYVDSWVDIAGYAQLVADRLTGNSR